MNKEAILIVDDELDARGLLTKVLQKEGYDPVAVGSGELALEELRKRRFCVVLLDYQLPGKNGIETLKDLLQEDGDCRVIIITSHGSIKLAVEAVRLGAHHFIQKPFDLDELRLVVQGALQSYRMSRENVHLKEIVCEDSRQDFIRGCDPKILEIWKMVEKVAPSESSVLLEGESGTGKEVFAQSLHRLSLRKAGPFVAINCGALVPELIESELFGHVRGAFTGAIATKKGRFEMADGGTLFLDEIGEMSPPLQAKLLRVLQEKTLERVGDVKTRHIDVRIISATNRDLTRGIAEKSFREDLYYRLNVVNLKIPPLRERRADIGELVEFFLAQLSIQMGRGRIRISPQAMHQLQNYSYPGNIRELRNILERLCLLCNHCMIELEDLSPLMISNQEVGEKGEPFEQADAELPYAQARGQFEIGYVTRLLTICRGNLSHAARLAGMDRNNLKDKIRKYGIGLERFKDLRDPEAIDE